MPVTHSATFKSFSSSGSNTLAPPPAAPQQKPGAQSGATTSTPLPSPVPTPPAASVMNRNTDEDKEKDSEDDSKITFTDKIKSIRVQGGDYDVFFMEHPGAYYVPYSFPDSKISPEQILNEAYKKSLPVTVTVDKNTDTLLGIEPQSPREPSAAQDSSLDSEFNDYREIFERAVTPK
jgi:hypothetical protein